MSKINRRGRSGIVIISSTGMRRAKVALTKPFKGKVATESPTTVTTAAGAVYRKSDLAKVASPPKNTPKEGLCRKEKTKSSLEEPKSKHQKKDAELNDDTESEAEDQNISSEQIKDLFQDSETVVTSRETPTGGGLNLAVKRAKPNLGGPTTVGPKTHDQVALKPLGETKGQNEVTVKSKGKSDMKKAAVTADEVRSSKQSETIVPPDQPSSSGVWLILKLNHRRNVLLGTLALVQF